MTPLVTATVATGKTGIFRTPSLLPEDVADGKLGWQEPLVSRENELIERFAVEHVIDLLDQLAIVSPEPASLHFDNLVARGTQQLSEFIDRKMLFAAALTDLGSELLRIHH